MGKKEKKHKIKKAVSKSKNKKRSSSSSSTSSEEWVERDTISDNSPKPPAVRENWMEMESCFSGKTRKELREEKTQKNPEDSKSVSLLDHPGQSERELNPFWKNGGSGLPSHDTDTTSSSKVGDKGAHWLRKALQRAKDTAKEEGRSLDDVISERWGSLDEFNKRLKDAERSERDSHGRHNSDRYRGESRSRRDEDYRHDSSKKRMNFRKPEEDSSYSRSTSNNYRSASSKKNWKKPSEREKDNYDSRTRIQETRPSPVEDIQQNVEDRDSSCLDSRNVKILTINELNYLFADALRAKLAGKTELAEKLQSKAELHKLKRINAIENKEIRDENPDKVVLLMETDSKGFTRPVKSLEDNNRGKRKAETHDGKKRLRYFADDDKHSLKDMFEAEKFNTVDDDQNTFMKLAMEVQNNDMDDDAVFDRARMGQTSKEESKKRAKLINDYNKRNDAVENCLWCLGSREMLHECIVIHKSKVFVAVPPSQSLTDNHCLIIPTNHVNCATLLDEDEWEAIMNMRKSLVQKFSELGEDVIFFEIANNLHKHPHMVINCVPVPKEIGETAPIYFKKAIMECEMEWSNNKKVVELAGRDVRKAVPKGLPYFSVDFGMQSGYAHVIEDKRLFPSNFAQEIIGGMLDLDHSLWRKQKKDSTENVIQKAIKLEELLTENKITS